MSNWEKTENDIAHSRKKLQGILEDKNWVVNCHWLPWEPQIDWLTVTHCHENLKLTG